MPEDPVLFYAVSVNNPTDAIPFPRVDTRNLSLETRIAHQAYALWDHYGRPAEDDISIWQEAERQVILDANVSEQESGVMSAPASFWTAFTPTAQGAGKSHGRIITIGKPASAVRRVG